jgi:hypothetical protein
MRVELRGFTETDAILGIACKCGNTRMLDEVGDFDVEEIYVYLDGVPEINLRCYSSESVTLKRISQGEAQCRQRYRVRIHREQWPPYIEVAHISPRLLEEVIEVGTINFPQVSN